MTFAERHSTSGLSLLTLWSLLVLLPAPASPADLTLEQANRRWAGGIGTLRIPVKIKRGKDKNGWYSGWWQQVPGRYTTHPITGKTKCPACANGEQPFSYLFALSDRRPLEGVLRDNQIPAGTAFSIHGWRKLSNGQGFFLEMQLQSSTVAARFFFAKTYKDIDRGMSLDRFAQIEQHMRIQILQLEAKDERLAPVAADPERHEPRLAPRLGVQPSERQTFKPAIRVEAVSVRPPRFAPGDEIEVLVTFTLEGVPPGSSFEITIEHQIWRDERQLAALPETVSYPAGTHTNSRTVRGPPDQAPGLYTLETKVQFAGVSDTGSALFQVATTP